jgi:hypothetical protein
VKANTQKVPSFIEPMKALPVEKLPEGDWLYEIKVDGYRALAFKDGKGVRLVSRNQKEFNYPQLLDALKLLPAQEVILYFDKLDALAACTSAPVKRSTFLSATNILIASFNSC